MRSTLLALFIFLLTACVSPVGGQTQPAISIVPSQFQGKTFEECERILGKPLNIQDPPPGAQFTDRSFIRTYASPIPGVAKIELFRAPEGGEDGPIPPTVNLVRYHFTKGKTWRENAAIVGLGPNDLTVRERDATKPKDAAIILRDKDGRVVLWSPSASTMKLREKMRNPDYDTLRF